MSSRREARESLSSIAGQDGTSVARCTWSIELAHDPESGLDQPLSKSCDKKAVVEFSIENRERRDPRDPKVLRYPRCAIHDTAAARARAGLDGYDIQELTQ